MKLGIIILLFFGIGMAVYGPSPGNGFVWDDEEQIVLNSAVHSLQHLRLLWSSSTFQSGGAPGMSGMYYKPVMTTAFAAIYTFLGPKPLGFHLVQILLHIANSVFLYIVFRRLLGKRWVISLALALVFLVHPANSETVLYVSALQDVLSFFFGILGLLILIQLRHKGRIVLVSLMFLLSLLSKETGVLWLAVSGMFVLLSDRKTFRMFLLSSIAVMGTYLWLRVGVAHIGFEKHGLTAISTMPFMERLVSIPAILVTYVRLLVWPVHLAINQQWVIRTVTLWGFWLPLTGILFVLGLWIYTAQRSGRRGGGRRRLFFFFSGWTALGFAFHLHLFPLDMTVAERWMYLPVAGLLGAIGAVVYTIKFKRYAIVMLGFLVVLLAGRTFVRTFDWYDGLTLYGRDIRYSRDAFDLENNYGVELYRAGRIGEAREHFERSIELAPHWWTSYNNLGAYWEAQGDLEKAAMLYKTAIDNGNYYLAYENYALILVKMGKYGEAEKFVAESLRNFPGNTRLRSVFEYLRSQKL